MSEIILVLLLIRQEDGLLIFLYLVFGALTILLPIPMTACKVTFSPSVMQGLAALEIHLRLSRCHQSCPQPQSLGLRICSRPIPLRCVSVIQAPYIHRRQLGSGEGTLKVG